MSSNESEWPVDAALDEAAAAHACAGNRGEAVWLLRRMFSLVITGGPASEPLRRYAEICDAALGRARNDSEYLQALNLLSGNPSNRPAKSHDERLRERAATSAAIILLTRNGLSKSEALERLGALSGKERRTLQRYLSEFGAEARATLEAQDSAELRALADRHYAAPLNAILSRKHQ